MTADRERSLDASGPEHLSLFAALTGASLGATALNGMRCGQYTPGRHRQATGQAGWENPATSGNTRKRSPVNRCAEVQKTRRETR